MRIKEFIIRTNKDFENLKDVKKNLYIFDAVLIIIYTERIEEDSLISLLKKDEICKSQDYKSKVAKINFLVSRSVLNLSLKYISGKEVDDLIILRNKFNKPYFENKKGIKFNISHTDGCIVIAFSKKDVGVDVEKINVKFNYYDILKSCFDEEEIKRVGSNHKSFFKYWTAKEAYLKYEGVGLLRSLKEIRIEYINNVKAEIKDKKRNKSKELLVLKFDSKYTGFICLGR